MTVQRAILTLIAAVALCVAMAQETTTTPPSTPSTTPQTDRRHVTPVKPETNRVLTPPKGTSEEIIQRYINGDSAQAAEQARKDSLKRVYKHYPLLTDVSFGLNFIEPLLMAFGQSYASADVSATLNMWNRLQPTLELGLGWANSTPDDMNFTYKGKLSPYVKVGANYNFLFKNTPDYQVTLGVRLGYSTFRYDVKDVFYANSYWQESQSFDLLGEKSHALWGEAVAGIKVKLINQVSMGWSIRYHGIFNYGKSVNSRPWFIPGYGPRGNSLGLTVSVFYTLPLHREVVEPLPDALPEPQPGNQPPPPEPNPESQP